MATSWLVRMGTQAIVGLNPLQHKYANNRFSSGFNADVVLECIAKTALNPAITLPLLLLSYFTRHQVVLRRLKFLFYCGLARWLNGVLNAGVLDNWESSHYEWEKEIAIVTGGSDGIGKQIALLLAEKNITVAILDIQPLTFKARMSSFNQLTAHLIPSNSPFFT